uniref:SMR family transporter n=1 Tax=Vreelandella venusta TaxID=44935 RepID=UPI0038CC1934
MDPPYFQRLTRIFNLPQLRLFLSVHKVPTDVSYATYFGIFFPLITLTRWLFFTQCLSPHYLAIL